MPDRGRPRLATNQKKLSGTLRKDRSFTDEPVPDVCIPKKPVFLKGPAAKEWDEVTQLLADQKLISLLDKAACAGYCYNYGEIEKLTKAIAKQKRTTEKLRRAFLKKIKEEGGDETDVATYSAEFLVIGAKGSTIINPLKKALSSAFKLMNEFGREFGLSPVARTRISTGKSEANDEWQEFDNRSVG
jgi:P27 family predicted phage terminase small subunit